MRRSRTTWSVALAFLSWGCALLANSGHPRPLRDALLGAATLCIAASYAIFAGQLIGRLRDGR